jgi:hypothetical protein
MNVLDEPDRPLAWNNESQLAGQLLDDSSVAEIVFARLYLARYRYRPSPIVEDVRLRTIALLAEIIDDMYTELVTLRGW